MQPGSRTGLGSRARPYKPAQRSAPRRSRSPHRQTMSDRTPVHTLPPRPRTHAARSRSEAPDTRTRACRRSRSRDSPGMSCPRPPKSSQRLRSPPRAPRRTVEARSWLARTTPGFLDPTSPGARSDRPNEHMATCRYRTKGKNRRSYTRRKRSSRPRRPARWPRRTRPSNHRRPCFLGRGKPAHAADTTSVRRSLLAASCLGNLRHPWHPTSIPAS